ncbi:MAG: fibronectin type III domain-containing protein [Oscillospiraceae bacterium]
MKKMTALLLSLIMALTLLTIPVNAETTKKSTVWNGSVSTSWYTGKKKKYNISKPSQLAGLAKLVNSGYSMEGVVINLTADITLNDTTNWNDWENNPPKNKFTPIGCTGDPINGYAPFAGLFNGNGHTIKGLYVNSYKAAGLFGYLYCACVSNVILEKGLVIGYDDGKTELINRGCYAGGIAGIAEGSVINQCENGNKVLALGPDSLISGARDAHAGGIVGSMHTENMSAAMVAGGFAAFGVFYNAAIFTDGSGGLIKSSGVVNCINNGFVGARSAHNSYAGGIAGWGNNGMIKNCFSTWFLPDTAEYSGDIAGGLHRCDIINCYSYKEDKKSVPVGYPTHFSSVSATQLDEKQMVSKEFPKALGTAFVYRKGDRPYLACDKRSASKSTSSSKPKVTIKDGNATITWNKAANAVSYIIYQKNSDGKYVKLKSTEKTSVTLKNIKSGKKYTIRIKAKYKDGTTKTIKNGDFSFTA